MKHTFFGFLTVCAALVVTPAFADTRTPWLNADKMDSYAANNLGANSRNYPVKIHCRLKDGWVQVQFSIRSRDKGVPFERWGYKVSADPIADLKKINSNYRKVNQVKVSPRNSCGLGYR